jgi:hypothetical protein
MVNRMQHIFYQLVLMQKASPNPAVDPAPSGRWTLRDKAAQRRSPLLQGLPQIRKCA